MCVSSPERCRRGMRYIRLYVRLHCSRVPLCIGSIRPYCLLAERQNNNNDQPARQTIESEYTTTEHSHGHSPDIDPPATDAHSTKAQPRSTRTMRQEDTKAENC